MGTERQPSAIVPSITTTKTRNHREKAARARARARTNVLRKCKNYVIQENSSSIYHNGHGDDFEDDDGTWWCRKWRNSYPNGDRGSGMVAGIGGFILGRLATCVDVRFVMLEYLS